MSKSKKNSIVKEDSDNEYDNMSEVNELEYQYDDDLDEDYAEPILDEEEDNNEQSECLIEKTIDEDNDYFENMHESEIKEEVNEKLLNKNERISFNRLTKYEMVRILGERTKQLTLGAKPLVKNYKTLPYDKIAEEELKLNMIPFKIKRSLPNGKVEIWSLDELDKDHLLVYLN